MSTFAEPVVAVPSAVPGPEGAARRLHAWAHALLLAATFCVFAWGVALDVGLVAGALATASGSLLADALTARRYRVGAIFGFATLSLLAGGALVVTAGQSDALAAALSPPVAVQVVDALRWGVLGLSSAMALRGVALRFRVALALEGATVVLAIATTVAAHRNGMIARPLDLSDWFWTQGIDPVVAFLGVGIVGSVMLAGVLAHARSPARTAIQLALVVLLGFFIASQIHSAGREIPERDVVGVKPSDEPRKGDQSQGGGGEGQPPPSDKDDKNSPFDANNQPKGQRGPGGDNRPSAVVVFHKDVTPAGGVFYFRHATFPTFNGVRLIEGSVPGLPRVSRRFPTARREVPGAPADVAGRTTVATDVALMENHSRMFALTDAVEVAPRTNPAPARFKRAYSVVSAVVTANYDEFLGRGAGERAWSDETWAALTELPRDERYHELAAKLQSRLKAGAQDDPLVLAYAVKQHLEETATYSFRMNYEGAEDPTAAFLFSKERVGYCVHLSHAAAYLLRAMGVPTRVSTGYAVSAKSLAGGSALLLKSGNAHAWAEIYLTGVGWIPIEVAPEKSEVEETARAEQDLQRLLGEMARGEGVEQRQSLQPLQIFDTLEKLAAWIPRILLAILALMYLIKMWRLVAPAFSSDKPRIAYRAALDHLSAVGARRALGESRERYASRVASTAPSFQPLTSVHVGAALGSRSIAGAKSQHRELVTLASGVAREVRAQVPWWRWVIGAFNPVSWLWSR